MLIKYEVEDGKIVLTSPYFEDIDTGYTKVEITGIINCCEDNCGESNTTLTIETPQSEDEDKADLNGDQIDIYPEFFGLTEFIDGIYKFTVKLFKENGDVIIESNCFFVDITTKCKVASLLDCLLKDIEKNTPEKISVNAHILHYALVNGSNCGCNCDEMCEIYRELVLLLANVNPQITNNCGC